MERIDEARDSLGTYCMNVCQAKCCRRGQLLLELKESLVIDASLKVDEQGYVQVPLENGCPKLATDFSCTVYTNRPRACREYPLYPKGKLLLVATSCDGVKAGKLKEYLAEFEATGYRIEFI